LALRLLVSQGLPPGWSALAVTALSAVVALRAETFWRRVMMAAGFPASMLASGLLSPDLALWWLLPLLALLLAYPMRSWSDAPLFPTPAAALQDLPQHLPLPARAAVLDAGCGLGHGLRAWRRAYPNAELHGVEWSPIWSLLARAWCPWARVKRGDMWAGSWAPYEVVYVFQRPESMPRVWAKACGEMRPGTTLVSLAFDVPDVAPDLQLESVARRAVWVYRIPPHSSRQGRQPICKTRPRAAPSCA